MSLKAAFFAAAPPKREPHTIPGVGDCILRGLGGDDYDRYESEAVTTDGDKVSGRANRALLVRLGVELEPGVPAFTDDDLPGLRAASAGLILPIAEAIARLSGLGKGRG